MGGITLFEAMVILAFGPLDWKFHPVLWVLAFVSDQVWTDRWKKTLFGAVKVMEKSLGKEINPDE